MCCLMSYGTCSGQRVGRFKHYRNYHLSALLALGQAPSYSDHYVFDQEPKDNQTGQ